MNQSEIEEALVQLLGTVELQQAQLNQQHQVVTAAITDLGKERQKWGAMLQDFREFPKQASESLEWTLGDAVKASVADSITNQRKMLHGAVNAAVVRLDKARDKTATVAITWGLIGALLGGALAGGGMWYAVTHGHIQQTVVIGNPEGFAEVLRPYLMTPARKNDVETTLDKLLAQRPKITEILDRYGAYDLRVFGSVARKEDTENSDIDFLVRYPGASLVTLCKLQSELTALLGKEVDLGTDVREPFRERVYSEAIRIA